MPEMLRDRQKRVARETILQSAADLIVEHGLEDLSLLDVAQRAGVSKRTLYNYFESRETLLSEICRWSDELTLELGGSLIPEGLETLPEVVPAVWRTWAAQGNVYKAGVKIDSGSSDTGISTGRRARHAALASAVRTARPDVNFDQSDEMASLFHALGSAPVFQRLTAEDGLELEAANNLISWAITVLRDALTNGNDPFEKEEPK